MHRRSKSDINGMKGMIKTNSILNRKWNLENEGVTNQYLTLLTPPRHPPDPPQTPPPPGLPFRPRLLKSRSPTRRWPSGQTET